MMKHDDEKLMKMMCVEIRWNPSGNSVGGVGKIKRIADCSYMPGD